MQSDLCGPMTTISFEEKIAFWRSRGSHMEIDSERQEEMMTSPPHPSAFWINHFLEVKWLIN
jgi:hypothetical protein